MSVTEFKPLLKSDIVNILQVSVRTIENLVARGEMPAPSRIGGRVMWHPEVFYAWLDQRLKHADVVPGTNELCAISTIETDDPAKCVTTVRVNVLRQQFRGKVARRFLNAKSSD